MAANDLDSAIEQSHAALAAILKGDPSVYKTLYSDRDDVTLGNPFGPYARGRRKVEETLDRAGIGRSTFYDTPDARTRELTIVARCDAAKTSLF
jgi:hypothetical protein